MLCIYFLFFWFSLCKKEIRLGSLFSPDKDTFDTTQGIQTAIFEFKNNEKKNTSHFDYVHYLKVEPPNSSTDIQSFIDAKELIVKDGVKMMLCPSLLSFESVKQATKQYNIPVVSNNVLSDSVTVQNSHMLLLHLDILSTTYHLVQHALQYRGCKRTGIISTIDTNKEMIIMLTTKLYVFGGINPPETLYFSKGSSAMTDDIINFVFDPSINRTCIFVALDATQTLFTLEAVNRDERSRRRSIQFFGFDGTFAESYWNPKRERLYKHFRFLIYFPDVANGRSQLIVRFHKTFRNLLAAHPDGHITINNKTFQLNRLKSNEMLEAYIATRYAMQILELIAQWVPGEAEIPTSDDIISAAYDHTFMIEDILMYRGINSCLAAIYDGDCFCNVISKTIYAAKVSGKGVAMPVSNTEVPDSQVVCNFVKCSIAAVDSTDIYPDHAHSIILRTELFNSSTLDDYFMQIQKMANHISFLDTISVDYTLIDPEWSAETAYWEVRIQLDSYQPLLFLFNSAGIFGTVFIKDNSPPVIYSQGYEVSLDEPKLISRDNGWNPSLFNFQFTLVDHIYNLAVSYQNGFSDKARIIVFSETRREAMLAKKTLNTAKINIKKSAFLSIIKVSEEKIIRLFNRGFCIFFISTDVEKINLMLKAVFMAKKGYLALPGSLMEISSFLESNKIYINKTYAKRLKDITLSSTIPEWWAPGSLLFSKLNEVVPMEKIINPRYSTSYVTGSIIALIIDECINKSEGTKLLYSQKTLSFCELVYGPFSNATCPPDIIKKNIRARNCQCQKGPRMSFPLLLYWWAMNRTLDHPIVPVKIQTCGLEFKELPQSKVKKIALLVVIIFIVVLILLAIPIVLWVYFDPHRCAPRDPKSPITTVFIEMASSSELWSRIPELMNGVSNRFVTLIRKNIFSAGGYKVREINDSFVVVFRSPIKAIRFTRNVQIAVFEARWPDTIDEVYNTLLFEAAEFEEDEEKRKILLELNEVPPEVAVAIWHGPRVRAGLDYGLCEIDRSPKTRRFRYTGATVNTACRIGGVANGGQTIISEALFSVLVSKKGSNFAVAERLVCTELGIQVLRGLENPIELYQLVPQEFSTRQFACLYLDIDNSGQDFVNSEDSDLDMNAACCEGDWMPIEQRISLLVNEPGKQNQMRTYRMDTFSIARTYYLLKNLLSTLDDSEKQKFVSGMCRAWRTPFKKMFLPPPKDRSPPRKLRNTKDDKETSSVAVSQSKTGKSMCEENFDPYAQSLVRIAFSVTCVCHLKDAELTGTTKQPTNLMTSIMYPPLPPSGQVNKKESTEKSDDKKGASSSVSLLDCNIDLSEESKRSINKPKDDFDVSNKDIPGVASEGSYSQCSSLQIVEPNSGDSLIMDLEPDESS